MVVMCSQGYELALTLEENDGVTDMVSLSFSGEYPSLKVPGSLPRSCWMGCRSAALT